MRYLPTALFLILAIIHLLPALAVFAPSKIAALYGIAPGDKALITLLQHRALLFALLCAAFVLAAFSPVYRPAVLIAGMISMTGFIGIAGLQRELSGSLRKIVVADIAGLVIAVCAAFIVFKLE